MSYQSAQFNRKQSAIRAMSDIASGQVSEAAVSTDKFSAVRYAKDLLPADATVTQVAAAPVAEAEVANGAAQNQAAPDRAAAQPQPTQQPHVGKQHKTYNATQSLGENVGRDERDVATVMWVASVLFLMIPGMLVLLNNQSSDYLKQQAREALNWTLTFFLGSVACTILVLIFIGGPLQVLLSIAHLVFCLLGANAARKAAAYRVPMTWRPLQD